ncbi:ABC transporter substrate-binding protein [Streptomyces dangxiongensis]|uniref:ABC transporter substrate-binding protein n=1 Tax=Streptomyces dangxiongensis TaxID=1442032 RepID=A0A3G2JP57_9ACTN|nr:ABC transporter substrate-binding protein [Streptomyces dangxiongensis]AYN43225.1 ABC transporter substrate-binding protein [Streptomyces dangxiongensis]
MNMLNQWPARLVPAGLAFALLTGCTSLGESTPVVVGMSDDVLATDPASGYDPGSWLLFNNVFQSLLSFPSGGTEPEPDAAEVCSFTDGRARVYKCRLKDGLRFSNGDPLTAEDVKFSFDRTLRIDNAAGPAVMFGTLDSIQTPNDKTVVFRLKVPDATFPSKIASGAGSIVDHRQYRGDELRTDGGAVGSGPYRLESFGKGEAVFSVNERYKGNARVKNSGVTLKFFHGHQDALKEAVLDDKVDVAYRGLTAQDISGIDQQIGRKDVDVVEGGSAEVQHLVFNMHDPVAGRSSVREAIAHVLDRDALVREVYRDTAIPLYSIVPAGIGGHTTAFFDRYGGRPSTAEATALLRADGITDRVRLTLWSTPVRYGPATDQEMHAIADQLNASGLFDTDVKSVPFDRYERDIAAGTYGVYVKGWVPDYPDADNFTAPLFGRGNVLGNHYENSTLTDELIPRTAAVSDRMAAEGEFAQIQDIVARQVPVLPVWQAKQYAVVRDGVHGVDYCLDASTVFRFWELSKD